MSILDFLKKIKLPGFEEDFIEDPNEKAAADAPRISGRVISDPMDELRRQTMGEEVETSADWGLKELARIDNPGDGLYLPVPGEED